MKQTVLGGIVGGVILFVWSFLAWVILPLHEPTLHRIQNEDAVISALQSDLNAKSVYYFPKGPDDKSNQVAMEEWAQKMRRGPVGMIVYNPQGSDPMMPRQMLVGFVLDLLIGVIIAWFLKRSTAVSSSYIARIAYCGMLGIFISLFSHLMEWNWMGFARDYTIAMILDTLIAMVLAGIGIAAIVKQRNTTSSPA